MIIPSYRLATLCIYLVNFAMAWDSFVTFLSLPAYWKVNNAPGYAGLYGMVFGCYSLAQSISAPFLGYWADKRTIREVVLWCVVIDIAGNLLFMGASCGSRTYFGGLVLITGRLMAGAAAGVIIIGLSFVTQLSTFENRIAVLNYYRVWGFIGRFFAAVISIGFIVALPDPISIFGSKCQVASYTLPPLTTIVLDLAVLALSWVLLKNPPAREARVPFWKDPPTVKLFIRSCILNIHFWAACVTMWTIFSQINALSVILFGMSTDPRWAWLPFIPFFLGLVLGWASVLWPLSLFFTDKQMMLAAPFIMVLTLFCFFQYATKTHAFVFYIGTTVLYMAFNIYNTAYQSYYTKVVGSTQYISTLMSALLVTGAFGQFCGPAFTTFFLTVSCDSPGCDCPVDTVCGCCKFNGINFLLPIIMLLMLGTTIYQYFYVQKIHLEVPAVTIEQSAPQHIETEKTALMKQQKVTPAGPSVNTTTTTIPE